MHKQVKNDVERIRRKKRSQRFKIPNVLYHVCPECKDEFQCTKIKEKTTECECVYTYLSDYDQGYYCGKCDSYQRFSL